MSAPKVEVKTIDYWGEAYYTVFIDGEEMTSAAVGRLPVKYRDQAIEVAKELENEYQVQGSSGE